MLDGLTMVLSSAMNVMESLPVVDFVRAAEMLETR